MNVLLLFFALPIAIIILAIVLEKILRCPILTAATFFAIFLIVAFTIFDTSFLVFAIVYTIIAFITAIIAEFFFRRCREDDNNESCCKCFFPNCKVTQKDRTRNNTITLSNQDIIRIAEQLARLTDNNNCCCNNSNDIATVNVTNNTTGGRTTWCCRRK